VTNVLIRRDYTEAVKDDIPEKQPLVFETVFDMFLT
jgi:hypothetical protein